MSQTLSNINLYLNGHSFGPTNDSFDLITKRKYDSLINYVVDIDNEKIKFEYDNAIITKAHLLLNNYDIPHIIMAPHSTHYEHINKKNVAVIDWGELCKKYPDNLGSGHCDELGHKEVLEILKPKIENLLNEKKISIL
jgi:hypothetical protein